MPLGVTSVQQISDPEPGVRIISRKGTFELFVSDIPNNVMNKSVSEIEAWINGQFSVTQPEYFAVVHVFSKTPFVFTIYTGNQAPEANWWSE